VVSLYSTKQQKKEQFTPHRISTPNCVYFSCTMKFIIHLILLLFSQLNACSQDTTYGSIYRLGSEKIQVQTTCYIPCKDDLSFINVHENESTSVEAAGSLLNDIGGKMMVLKHNKSRYISFYIGNKKYIIDPNRIFTKKGIDATLKNLGPHSAEAANEVAAFAQHILTNFVDGKSLVVALHNNTDENYSIASYLKGGDEARNAADVFINAAMDKDDFIVTTDSSLFRRIKERNINVVLQDNKRAVDDGSLSIYAARKNIPYLNIEAQSGHLKEQIQMLEAIKDVLKSYKKQKP
jgi:uncharacterized protein YaiI (UPF0178 family)